MFSCEAVTELDLDTLESSENIEFEIFCICPSQKYSIMSVCVCAFIVAH